MTAAEHSYPSQLSSLGVELFLRWMGSYYARTTSVVESQLTDGLLTGVASVGRRWSLAFSVLDTVAALSTPEFERERSALERRLDDDGRSIALWAPRAAPLPSREPASSALIADLDRARPLDDGRLEAPRPVTIHLRRVGTTGSVINVVGGLAGHWAQFTNKVPGTFQLDSRDLHRLPHSEDMRVGLANVIVQAAAQPTVDDGLEIRAEDCWTVNDLGTGRSYVVGLPAQESDEASAALRRELRRLLRRAGEQTTRADARALIVLGVSTYATDEKLSWALRGMDPRLYSGFDIVVVVTDGLVKPVLQPPRSVLPWDAPLG